MASEQVTPFHPFSAGRAAHPSGAKDEIVDLALWKEHQHPKRRVGQGPEGISSLRARGPERLSRTSAVTTGVRRAPGPTDLWPGTAGRAPNGRLNSKWGDVIRPSKYQRTVRRGKRRFLRWRSLLLIPGHAGRASRGLSRRGRCFSGERKLRGQMGRLVASTPRRSDSAEIRGGLLLCGRSR